jgi:hypothetical protein
MITRPRIVAASLALAVLASGAMVAPAPAAEVPTWRKAVRTAAPARIKRPPIVRLARRYAVLQPLSYGRPYFLIGVGFW